MSYSPPPTRVKWDGIGNFYVVTIERSLDGEWYAWRIPHNGLVSQALAAELLGVSLMSVNNWVRTKKVRHIKVAGQPSAIPLREVMRVRSVLAKEKQLRGR
jgi:hypothetical protein